MRGFRSTVDGAVRHVLRLVGRHAPGERRMLFGLGVALARVARIDRDLAQEEVETMREVLAGVARLGPDQVGFVVSFALASVPGGSTPSLEGFGLERLGPEQKERLVHALHAVADADGEFSELELDEIDRIVAELGA